MNKVNCVIVIALVITGCLLEQSMAGKKGGDVIIIGGGDEHGKHGHGHSMSESYLPNLHYFNIIFQNDLDMIKTGGKKGKGGDTIIWYGRRRRSIEN